MTRGCDLTADHGRGAHFWKGSSRRSLTNQVWKLWLHEAAMTGGLNEIDKPVEPPENQYVEEILWRGCASSPIGLVHNFPLGGEDWKGVGQRDVIRLCPGRLRAAVHPLSRWQRGLIGNLQQ